MESSGRQQYIALAIPVVGQSLVVSLCLEALTRSSLLFAYDDVVSMQSAEREEEKKQTTAYAAWQARSTYIHTYRRYIHST